ncbi:MAG: hypothetical protein DMG90_00935 [Acidobacteria bacterium]|nr:MAG: hypothetical protein DMG90_00935 [Acidobacteriota bacterium]
MLNSCLARIALTVACFALPARPPADLTAANSRKVAPDFALNDSKGNPIKLSSFKGRVVLLDFWGTYREVCTVEVPWYVEFQGKYKERGLSVVGVSVGDDWASVNSFVEAKKVNYPIVIGNWGLAKQFGVDNGLPVTLLIDRDGKIADLNLGMVNKKKFEHEIQFLLKENAAKRSSK